MDLKDTQIQEIIEIISNERLASYDISQKNNLSNSLNNYIYNIKFSKAFYPILSILEIALRNKINNSINLTIKANWLLSELKTQTLLLNNEYKVLLEAEKKLKQKNKKITEGNLISELSFGFWVNLCKKAYKTTFWDKKGFFEIVFPYFPKTQEMNRIKFISSDLKNILQLRNRIFHHEIILNHKIGIENYYNITEKILSYISKENLNLLKDICRFSDIIKQKP